MPEEEATLELPIPPLWKITGKKWESYAGKWQDLIFLIKVHAGCGVQNGLEMASFHSVSSVRSLLNSQGERLWEHRLGSI